MALLSRIQPEADLGKGWQFCWKSASLDLKHKQQTQDVFRKTKQNKTKKTDYLPVWAVHPKKFMQYNHCLVQLQIYSETCQQPPLLSGLKLKSSLFPGTTKP